MQQPIELDQVERLIRHYNARLKLFRSVIPSLRQARVEKTIQVLEHYLKLCRTIDREPDDQ